MSDLKQMNAVIAFIKIYHQNDEDNVKIIF